MNDITLDDLSSPERMFANEINNQIGGIRERRDQ